MTPLTAWEVIGIIVTVGFFLLLGILSLVNTVHDETNGKRVRLCRKLVFPASILAAIAPIFEPRVLQSPAAMAVVWCVICININHLLDSDATPNETRWHKLWRIVLLTIFGVFRE